VAGGGSPKVTLTSTSDPNTLELVQTEANAWKEAGFDVSLDQVADQSQYINVAIGGEYQAMTWRNHPGGDPDTQYVWWYNKDGDPGVNPVNFGRIPDKEIGKLLEQGRVESDPATREQIYEDLNRRFADQVWNLWENWSIWSVPTSNDLHAEGGVLGPDNPDGSKPFPGLATGHPVYQFWRAQQ
jgi:peptide/nickel transport system substrate-binding protein